MCISGLGSEGSKQASKEERKNGDIEALADAMRALKNRSTRVVRTSNRQPT